MSQPISPAWVMAFKDLTVEVAFLSFGSIEGKLLGGCRHHLIINLMFNIVLQNLEPGVLD